MMHTCSLGMFLFVLVSSFLALPNFISVEARRLTTTSSNGGRVFKVDLIHRDYSPQSPYYNSSMTLKDRRQRLPLGYISRGHNNIRLLSSTSNTTNNDDVAMYDIFPEYNIGEYLLKIDLGTPKLGFFAIADTGSDLTWVPCLPCEKCTASNTSSPFDPTKSSTYQAIPCNTSACNTPDVATSCPLDNTTKSSPLCQYRVIYGDGSTTSGILAKETISMPSSDGIPLNIPSSVFGCGTNQTDFDGEGLIGLGLGPSSLISQLGPGINHKFSYCLPPLIDGVNGKLAFGADVRGPGIVSTPFFIRTVDTYYHLILNGIGIGDDDNNTNEIPMPSSSGLDIIIDSGTTLTFLPASVYDSVKTALEAAVGPGKVYSSQELGDVCHDSSEQFNMPDVAFRFKGADVLLKKINIFWEVEDGISCLAMAATNGTYIFGNVAQVNFHVGYDVKFQQVSFAPTNCTNF